jgi:hypothetical protein
MIPRGQGIDDARKLGHAILEERAARTERRMPRRGRSHDWCAAVGARKLFAFARFPKSQWKSIRAPNAFVFREARHAGLREASSGG